MCHKYYDGFIEYLYAVNELSTKHIIISSNPHTISEMGIIIRILQMEKQAKK